MDNLALIAIYCFLIVLASLVGGWIPLLIKLTHQRLELAISFVSGAMLGVAMLHLLPHAWSQRAQWMDAADTGSPLTSDAFMAVSIWVLAGFLVMFLLERFFCFHHHDVEDENGCNHNHDHKHGHTLTWAGAALGLTLHSLIAGVALGASVVAEKHGHDKAAFAGFGTFLMIVLHKPFDSLTLGTLMAAQKRSRLLRHIINGSFGLVVPIGVAIFFLGMGEESPSRMLLISQALAFSAGTFLCIALSDLLPELQFHQHDRVKLTVALLLGLALAWGVSKLEAQSHDHSPLQDTSQIIEDNSDRNILLTAYCEYHQSCRICC